MYNITTKIADYLEGEGLKLSCKEANNGNLSYVELGFGLDHGSVKIRFISANEDSVKCKTGDFAKFPLSKLADAYEAVNFFNNEYKFVKFSVDPDDGAISAEYDFLSAIMEAGREGEVAYEICQRTASIVDDVMPEIEKKGAVLI